MRLSSGFAKNVFGLLISLVHVSAFRDAFEVIVAFDVDYVTRVLVAVIDWGHLNLFKHFMIVPCKNQAIGFPLRI